MESPISLADLLDTGEADRLVDHPVVEGYPMAVCGKCKQEKERSPEFWVTRAGVPHGRTCKACDAERSSRKARREAEVAKLVNDAAGLTRHGDKPKLESTAREAFKRQLDVTHALRTGVEAVNMAAGDVIAKVMGFALTDGHPHQEWALKMVAERLMPLRMFQEMGTAAAGSTGRTGPNIQINVLPAGLPAAAQVPATVTVRAIEDRGNGAVGGEREGANDDEETQDR